VLKKYQQDRPDLLINTDWVIPSDQLSGEAVKSRGLKLFHGRWVTKAEKNQLKDEQNAYCSIRIIGCLLIVPALSVAINTGKISQGTSLSTFLTVGYALVAVACGIGLIRFARFARYLAILIFISFFVLPFSPLLADEKGAPLFIVLGVMGLYYLLRRTARKILWPQTGSNPDEKKNKNSIVRKGIYLIILCMAVFAGYFAYDMSQAKRMAADACIRATQGMPLEEFLSKFSENDYRIIRRTEYIMIVPKRGMGRNSCTVSHDGRKIIESKTEFND
jgi:hypothetical protein